MVKHTQTNRRQQPMNCLSVFDHFVGLAIKGLTLQLHINKLMKMYELKLQFVIWQPNNLVKQFFSNLPTNCFVVDHFVELSLKVPMEHWRLSVSLYQYIVQGNKKTLIPLRDTLWVSYINFLSIIFFMIKWTEGSFILMRRYRYEHSSYF